MMPHRASSARIYACGLDGSAILQPARLKQEYNKNPIYRVLYLFIGFYRFVRTARGT